MVDMRQSAEEAADNGAIEAPSSAYPYGLEISLDEEGLAKLGFSTPPAVGKTMVIRANVTVTAARQNQTTDGEVEASSSWQITDMEVQNGGTSTGDVASILYGS